MKTISIFLLSALIYFPAFSAEVVRGQVLDENEEPVTGANVHWAGTQNGTTTDGDGLFQLTKEDGINLLVTTYVGYENDTTQVRNAAFPVRVKLNNDLVLDEVVVSRRKLSTISSRILPLQTQQITSDELYRAACCNLAESFETNPSVDVSYTDAATGARQIRLLGLSGTYVQMLTENYPNFRGVATPYGLDYVPGPWLESIFVSKGTSSVKNGYEAMAGQINVEFKKPKATADVFSANVFAGDNQRFEVNMDGTALLTPYLSSTLLAHVSTEEKEFDMNHDGFLDTPLKRQINLMNRWEYKKDRYIGQFGARFLNEDRTGGQTSNAIVPPDSLYRISLKTNRVEGFSKNGFMLSKENSESVALIVSGSYHEQISQYGFRPYHVYETNLYGSLMYERSFTKMHRISTGLSMNYDRFNENYILDFGLPADAPRTWANNEELVTGGYAEYTFNNNDKFIVLAGLRADYSDLHNWFVTPRLHLKYNFTEWLHLRASAGKGFRNTRVLPENNFYMASSRRILIEDNLKMEEAWNYGTNLSLYIPLFGKELTVNAEYYYTNFRNQVVVDVDSNPNEVSFYNLNGDSYSSNFQVEATYPFFKGFTLTGAYRKTDVKTTYNGVLKEKPFNNDYKALVTASYQTPLRKWQFDLTSQFNGGGRMPEPDKNKPLWDERFDSFVVLNAQATKFFRNWSVYVGAENLLDFVQDHPIIQPENPFGDHFDSTLIWGPLHGRKFYAGLRYNIPRLGS